MSIKLPFADPINEVALAVDAAMQASKAVMEIYAQDFAIEHKDDDSPITEADLQSNQIIKEVLSGSGLPILSEEDTDDKSRLGRERIWIVDPLDGTSDFVNKTGEFTIMIALVEKRKPVLGIISRPTTNMLFLAQSGSGAFVFEKESWKKMIVSKTSELKKCSAVGSRFHLTEAEKEFFKSLGVERFASRGSSLKVAEICMGMADIYLTTSNKIKQWDTCASYCLITESGGKMTDMYGNDVLYNTERLNHENGLLVTNGLVHDQIIKKYQSLG
ncbi:MAG TPA: 3'(2'),5'-bisphosphate nucleotidase CysQ [Candidatus Nitrosotenuis sp.]|nr:3'(2'),5'-bisphosphate nucleotidase CysQ [Candidatus Nitrosotenuis sp.]